MTEGMLHLGNFAIFHLLLLLLGLVQGHPRLFDMPGILSSVGNIRRLNLIISLRLMLLLLLVGE